MGLTLAVAASACLSEFITVEQPTLFSELLHNIEIMGDGHGAIRILHVDDEPEFVEMAVTFVERENDRFDIETATSPSEGLDRLDSAPFDCIVSDYEMPTQNGLEFFRDVREEHPDLPFILYTGEGSEEVASDAISAGVTDYLQKERGTSQYTVLANRIRNAVENYHAQTELDRREKRLSLLFDQSPLGVVEWDEQFDFVRMNDTAEEILGYAQEDLVGRSWEEIVSRSDRDAVADVVSDLLEDEGGYRIVNENIRKDGDRVICEWHNRVVTDEDGDVIGVFSHFQDITDRKEREQGLQELKSQYETLVENFPDGAVFLIDTDLTYVRAGGKELSKVGLSPDDIEGVKPHALFPEEVADELRHYFEEGLDGNANTFEQVYGSERYRVQTVPVRIDGGEITHVMAVSYNVTERLADKRDLEAQNERLEEFTSIVSHDLRNPLNVAEGNLELARETGNTDYLDPAADAIERSQALIEDLLTLAQEGERAAETESVDLAEVARTSWQTTETQQATLDANVSQVVEADRSRLQQLFENLYRNAVEHGGEDVAVSVGTIDRGFYVADTGPGITEPDHGEIFEAGYSTNEDGTGFGLRIVEQIVDAHGWKITATESEQGGARFEITGVEPVE